MMRIDATKIAVRNLTILLSPYILAGGLIVMWEFIGKHWDRPEGVCGAALGIELLSPNKQQKAIVYQFDCGATTPFTTQISVLDSNEKVHNRPGNVFTAYGGSREGSWHGPYVEVKWIGDEALQISYVSDATVEQRGERERGIAIHYVELPANNTLQPTGATGG